LTTIEGDCGSRFARVKETFAENFRDRREVGAAVSVTVDGESVVDLWGGHADAARTRPWQRDTLVNVYSTTKGMTAICAHQLVDEGLLDLDAPVAEYWPEFAQAGKGDVPVRLLLGHRAGLPAVSEVLPAGALYDWSAITAALAAQEPWWTPGDGHGYHAVTFGWLVGEVVRRITGKSLGTTFRERVAGPLGADFHIGLAASEHDRTGELHGLGSAEVEGEGKSIAMLILQDPAGMVSKAFLNPPSLALGANHAAWREAEIPGANGHATAHAIARVYAALACGGDLGGVHVLSREGIDRCRTEQSHGRDRILQRPTRFGLGFMLSLDEADGRFGPSPGAFGHPGMGGSVGFADPERRVSFGYAMNRMGPHILLDPRAIALIDSVYACLD